VDEFNEFHFYILGRNNHRGRYGPFLSYEIAVRSTVADAYQVGGVLNLVTVGSPTPASPGNFSRQTFRLTHSDDASATDIVRINLEGALAEAVMNTTPGGYEYVAHTSEQNAVILNNLYAIEPGQTIEFDVFIRVPDDQEGPFDTTGLLQVVASSETNPSKTTGAGTTIVADVTVSAANIARAIRGRYVDIVVNLDQNLNGISSMFLTMGYNAAVLEKISITPSGLLPLPTAPPDGVNPFTLNFVDFANSTAVITGTGELATVRFRILDDAAVGTTPITLNVDSAYRVVDFAPVSVGAAAVNGSVTVATVIPGDVNGDGRVTAADLLLLSMYLAGHDVVICREAADITGTGTITSADLMLLSMYLAGHPVILGPPR
jgi:hypothetical protein